MVNIFSIQVCFEYTFMCKFTRNINWNAKNSKLGNKCVPLICRMVTLSAWIKVKIKVPIRGSLPTSIASSHGRKSFIFWKIGEMSGKGTKVGWFKILKGNKCFKPISLK